MPTILAFGWPSGWEWLIVLAVLLLIFGHRLPAMMRGLGTSARAFKDGLDEGKDDQDPSGERPAGPDQQAHEGERAGS